MTMLKTFIIAITLLLVMSPAASAQAPQWKNAAYDAVRDFSSQQNPNGVWSYGWKSTLTGPLNLYTFASSCETPGISWWAIDSNCDGPKIGHDIDKKECYYTWCLPPTYLSLHPGPIGQFTVLRWTAPFPLLPMYTSC